VSMADTPPPANPLGVRARTPRGPRL
jgi:hypothetical protein